MYYSMEVSCYIFISTFYIFIVDYTLFAFDLIWSDAKI